MNRVYIANFGEGYALWPIAKANQTIITIDNVAVHGFWQAGDRTGYIDAALEHTLTALGERPSRPTAGRWYNLVSEMQETEGDIWISRQCEDKQMRASPDRIDSNGHYTPDNVQIVCWFINRWKGADDDQLVVRLIEALRTGS